MAIGRDVIIEATSDGGTTWAAVAAGERSSSISIAGEAVDLTDKSSSGWRILDTRASLNTLEISLSGTLKDDTLISLIMNNDDNVAHQTLRMVFPGFGTFEGAFYFNSMSIETPYDDAQTFEGAFMSAGVITWTAE